MSLIVDNLWVCCMLSQIKCFSTVLHSLESCLFFSNENIHSFPLFFFYIHTGCLHIMLTANIVVQGRYM